MNPYGFDDGRTRFSARLAVGIAVFAALVLGAATGPGLFGQAPLVLLGLAGAGAAVNGLRLVATESSRERAVGSVWFVLGAVIVVVALGVRKPTFAVATVTFCAILAVLFVAADAFVGTDEDYVGAAGGVLSRSLFVLVGTTVVAAGVHVGVFRAIGFLLVVGYGFVALASPLASFVVLLLEALALSVLLDRAIAALDAWLPRRQFDARETSLGTLGVDPGDVPRGVYVVLAFLAFAALTSTGAVLMARLLAVTGPFGSVVRTVLTSPVPHVLFGLAILLFGGIAFARLLQRLLVTHVGGRPPESMASATGGVVVSVVVGVLSALPPVVSLVNGLVPAESVFGQAFATYGVGTTVLGLSTAILVSLLVVFPVGVFVFSLWFVPSDASGFGLGAGSLLVASIAAGLADAAAVAVFVGIAASLATWDLGLNATLAGREVGRYAESRRAEVIHAAGVIGVGLATLVVTLLGVTFLGVTTLAVDVPKWRAVGALSLLLVSLVAFARLATKED